MKEYSRSALAQIARYQKQVLWLLALCILIMVGSFSAATLKVGTGIAQSALPLVLSVGLLVALVTIGITAAVLTFRLAKALKLAAPFLWVICSFIPHLNMVVLLILNVQATAALRANGIQVGFMGANMNDFQETLTRNEKQATEGFGSPK